MPRPESRPPNAPYVVVITGASAGVGRATARAFANLCGPNDRLALLARGRAGLAAAQAEVEAAGATALALSVDVADPAQVEAAAATVDARFGPPDVWVNNAMTSVFSPVRELLPEEIRRVTEVTYLGQVYGTLAALRRMLPRDHGVIIMVGSALAYRGIPLQSVYCGAKHAIQGFTESLRSELEHDHSRVRVTMVQMPGMNTPQFSWVKSRLPHKAQPVPPIFQPEVAAEAIVFAASHARRQILVGGSTVEAVQANKFIPGLLDRYLGRTGFKSQQTSEPEDPARPHNLHSPVDDERDFGAHGAFDDQAVASSSELWFVRHRPAGKQWLVAGGVAASIAAAAWAARRRAA
ncbi:MAG: SDR family oxidoreductase [Terriglobales bacterium]